MAPKFTWSAVKLAIICTFPDTDQTLSTGASPGSNQCLDSQFSSHFELLRDDRITDSSHLDQIQFLDYYHSSHNRRNSQTRKASQMAAMRLNEDSTNNIGYCG